MRGQDSGGVARPDVIEERRQEVATGKRIEGGQRLIEQEQLRPCAQRQSETDLRLLAARQFGDLAILRQARLSPALLRGRDRRTAAPH